jgi:hypothetical protein
MQGAARGNGVIKATPSADHSTKKGFFVILSSALVATISATAASDIPHGVIVDGEATTGQDSIALFTEPQPVKVKLGAAATAMSFGTLHATDGTVCDDPGTGARVRVCLFLESGVADELVDAVLIYPTVLS